MDAATFETSYQDLSHYERQVLAILALTSGPITQGDLIDCLRHLEVFASDGKPPAQRNVKAATDKLEDLGFCWGMRECSKDVADFMLRKLLTDCTGLNSPILVQNLTKVDFANAVKLNCRPRNISRDQERTIHRREIIYFLEEEHDIYKCFNICIRYRGSSLLSSHLFNLVAT